MTISGRTALVTGGTEGIGGATVAALAGAGARVAFCARSAGAVRDAEEHLRAKGQDVRGFTCDVTDPDQVDALAVRVRAAYGDPGILVNNAGIGRFAPLDEMDLATWDSVLATNVRSLFLVTRAFLPAMKAAGVGDIVNIVSLAGKNGMPGGTAYTASKHAALGFSRSLLLEARPYGVRVVAVCPGSVRTAFFAGRTPHTPLEKMLTAEDVAHGVLAALTLPRHATLSEMDLRPANP